MEKHEALINKFRKIIKGRKYISRTNNDPEENESLTLKRTKVNSVNKPLSNTESSLEGPCQTKRFKSRKIAKQCRWVLTVLEGIDRGRQFIGATSDLKVGRQPENHICLRDPKVSRFHALIRVKGSCLIIKDLQSTNGTFVNNAKIRRHKLHTGDLIKVGDTLLQVVLEKY